MPLPVGRESSLALLNSLEGTEKILGVVAQLDPRIEAPTGTDLHSVGTLAKVHKMVRMPNGNVVAFLEGIERIRVMEVLGFKPFLKARVEAQPDLEDNRDAELTALERNVQELFREVVARSPQLSDDLQTEVMGIESPGRLADFVASTLPSLSTMIRQEQLETFSVRKRLEALISELTKEREVLDLRNKIHDQVQEQVNQSQREFLLREQMKAIQKELGESDDGQAEIEELRKKVEESGMSAEAKKECDRELKRLAKMTPASAEYMVARTYLEWMTSLPWNKTSGTEDIDIPKAQAILDEDHYDLVKIKNRILDYLAVKKLQPGMKGPILCFVGPPGVGKTSLGKSIARALGRKFVRISLGGMHDEAEIRGHRRTYIGALPGQIIQGIRRAETMDPVLMLDEVDKLGRDFRGDPSAALMEVLDPEQNSTFRDHYLDVPFDLSKVLFIATANWLDPIPEPLRDRMEIIELSGYTEEEKVHIAKMFLIARQAKENGLALGEQIEFTDEASARTDSPLHARSGRAQPRTRNRHAGAQASAAPGRREDGQARRHARSDSRSAGHSEGASGEGSGRARPEAGRFGGPGVDSGRRRHRLHRSEQNARREDVHDDRASGRRDAGIHAGGAHLGSCQLRTLRHRSGLLPQAGRAHSRAVRCGTEGRSFRRRCDGHGAGQLADRQADSAARGDDRRNFALRHRVAGGRNQGKGARREACGNSGSHPSLGE